jgi:hypothetical protein
MDKCNECGFGEGLILLFFFNKYKMLLRNGIDNFIDSFTSTLHKHQNSIKKYLKI